MKTFKLALMLALTGSLMLCVSSVYAIPYGTEITIYDGVPQNPSGINATHEDNETGTNMVQSQAWDLEGFFLNGKNLSIVGGFNFYTGKDNMKAGDIFIDTNGDAVHSPATIPSFNYNPGYQLVSNAYFKYDYVLDINWEIGTFDIVKLNSNSILKDTEYGAQYNTPSNPWVYVSGGVETIYSGSFNTYGKASKTDAGFDGWSGTDGAGYHYVATFDISLIPLDQGAVFQNTMECGNDVLIGKSAPVPEPATMLLLGTGLIGLGGLGRKRMFKKQ